MRRRKFIFLNLIGLLLGVNQITANAKPVLDFPVEVVEVKEKGLSDRDESKTVVEIHWRVSAIEKEKIASFNLVLSATYANGTTIQEKRRIEKNALSAQIEIPSVKTNGSRPSAIIKKLDARVFAVISKN
jgi:hypothetical protein